MDRFFSMAELRRLVARALQDTDYVPAASARVRAVPDTRTIRYYTTLGLMDRPAEMRGRTAFYDAKHVMQLVAIKRLQAKNESLSDIQQRLTGLPPKELKSLAALPTDFWKQAERYLRESQTRSAATQKTSDVDVSGEFWSRTAALPSTPDASPKESSLVESSACEVSQALRINLHPQVQLSIDTTAGAEVIDAASLRQLQSAAESLISELVRQSLIVSPSTPRHDARS
ncbi:MerR family transcriptional regulator [Novipirellula sp. SH528]|uniref:helix-turn-helix domain-containing protein n=1 Tax=Novipirellula sp. SH528 TaxID=3454466 RepID=UPI003F9F53C3